MTKVSKMSMVVSKMTKHRFTQTLDIKEVVS